MLAVLEYLHGQHPAIIHRDIKPQNVKVMPDNTLILLDFGLAKGGLTQHSRSGSSVYGYTLGYAPLEQMKGHGTDARSDLYSVSATLWNLLTAQQPVDARLREQAATHRLPDPLRPANELNRNVPAPLAQLLSQALALHPNQRPPNATTMRAMLRHELERPQRQREQEAARRQAEEARRQAEVDKLQRELEAARRQAEYQRQQRQQAEAAHRQAEYDRKQREQVEAARRQAEYQRQQREQAEAARSQAEYQRQQREQAEAAHRQAEYDRKQREQAEAARQAEYKRQQRQQAQHRNQPSPNPPISPTHQPTIPPPSLIRLSAWNPLDHLRLLWWTLITPQQFKSYQEQFGEAAVKQTGKWLVSSLIWLPFLFPTLALGLEALPRSADAFSPTTYLWISGALFIAWLLTGIFGDSEDEGAVGLGGVLSGVLVGVLAAVLVGGPLGVLAAVLSGGLVAGLMRGCVGVLVGVLVGGLVGGLVIGVVGVLSVRLVVGLSGVLAGAVEESVKTGRASWVARGAFGLLVAIHAFLVWFSFLGGWRVFGQ